MSELIDFVLHIDQHLAALSATHGNWLYALLFLIIFCETGLVITPFLPGDSLLFASGAVASLGGLNVHLLAALLCVAAIIGDAVNFALGKYFGAKWFANPNSRIFRREYLDKTHAFYAKYGGKTIIIARFVPIVRTFAPFVAGMGRMDYPRFVRYNCLGAVLWVGSLCYAGYFFGRHPWVQKNFGAVVLGIIVVSVLPMVYEIAKAKLTTRKNH